MIETDKKLPDAKQSQLNRQQKIVKNVFIKFLTEKGQRKTSERFAILNEIYSLNEHFEVDTLYQIMSSKNYDISIATLYNTLDLLLQCGLVQKHQFGSKPAFYEKSYFNRQHDHVILTDSGEIKEFCDPRIYQIKKSIEKIFDIKIHDHSLYFYATKQNH